MAKNLALFIGNSYYEDDNNYSMLHAANNDAQDLAELFELHGVFNECNLICDGTSEQIRIAIGELFYKADNGDLVLLYFSGHGDRGIDGKPYLVVRNSHKSQLFYTGISETFIHEAISNSRANHHVIILDCCYSGAFRLGSKSGENKLKFHILQGQASAVLTSSLSYQQSIEEPGERNSLFTKYLLNGIKSGEADKRGDNDSYISVSDLFDYAQSEIRRVMPIQTPDVQIRGDTRRIILARVPTTQTVEYSVEQIKELLALHNPPEQDTIDKIRVVLNDGLRGIETKDNIENILRYELIHLKIPGWARELLKDIQYQATIITPETVWAFNHINSLTANAQQNVNSVAISPDGNQIVIGGGRVVDEPIRLSDFRFSSNGFFFLDVKRRKKTIDTLLVYKRNQYPQSLVSDIYGGHTGKVTSVAFSADGQYLVTSAESHDIRIWDTGTGHLLKTIDGHRTGAICLAVSPDGKFIASGGYDGMLKLWDWESGKLVAKLYDTKTDEVGNRIWAKQITFSPDGGLIAGTLRGSVLFLWHINELENSLIVHEIGDVFDFSPRGNYIAGTDSDSHVIIYDLSVGEVIKKIPESRTSSIAYSPDGKILATCSKESHISLWHSSEGKLLSRVTAKAEKIVFSRDGRFIVSWDCGFSKKRNSSTYSSVYELGIDIWGIRRKF